VSFKTGHPSSGIGRVSNIIQHAALAYTLAPSANEWLIYSQLSISAHEFIPESAHIFLRLLISATSMPVFARTRCLSVYLSSRQIGTPSEP
jgi:hypothetical protein